jgi:sulfatase maturation enzyme AslB (radical SAM superfamily)
VACTVGDISKESIDAIWNGEKIKRLREALAQYDLRYGCGLCEWRMSGGTFSSLTMKAWDRFPVTDFVPAWPQMMEFSISNTCNLECIMCAGDSSSAIRAHREKLPPLVRAYHDAFFVDLEKYLPHLTRARFLGGEPFLQQECFRIWEMMICAGLRTPCHVTTNGTQWNARVESVLSKLPFGIAISMDGFTKKTVESIRVHAVYETLLANFRAFHAYARANETSISLTFCLMRQNWQELGEFCVFAEEWQCPVFVNTVRRPPDCSLYTLSTTELKLIVESMEKEAITLLPRLKMNAPVWLGELERLRSIVRQNPSGGLLKVLANV